jgi:hypothetical protein
LLKPAWAKNMAKLWGAVAINARSHIWDRMRGNTEDREWRISGSSFNKCATLPWCSSFNLPVDASKRLPHLSRLRATKSSCISRLLVPLALRSCVSFLGCRVGQ